MSCQKGIELFHSNRFEDAKRVFTESMEAELSSIELRECQRFIIKILRIEGSKKELGTALFQYGRELIKCSEFDDAADVLNECYTMLHKEMKVNTFEVTKREVVNGLWDALIGAGEIESLRKVATSYIEELIASKNFVEGMTFVNKAKGIDSKNKFFNEASVIFYILQNDTKSIDQYFDHIWKGDKYKALLSGQLKRFASILSADDNIDSQSSYLTLSRLYDLIEDGLSEGKVSIRKEIINTLYQYIISNPSDPTAQFLALKYSIKAKRKKLYEQTSQIIKTNKSWFVGNNKLLDACIELVEIGQGIKFADEETIEVDEEFDMATDLFASPLKGSAKKRAANAVGFLIERGEDDRAQILMGKIKGEGENTKATSPILPIEQYDKSSLQNIEAGLLEELNRYSQKYYGKERELDDIGIKKAIEYMSLEDIVEAYNDVVVALHQLEMYSLAERVLERVRDKVLSREDFGQRMEYKYLQITTLIGLCKYHDALAVADDVSRLWPLSDEEKVCFLYLKAEIHKMLGDSGRALDTYLAVSKLDSDYRLVKDRIKEFE